VLINKGLKESMIIFTALLTAAEKQCCLAENGSHCSCKTLCSLPGAGKETESRGLRFNEQSCILQNSSQTAVSLY